MSNTVISDKYGNRIKISDKGSTVNLIPNWSEKKMNISNRLGSTDSIISAFRSKIDRKENKELVRHSCIKGINSCQEKEDGNLWFYIGTYKSRINFCPYCGYRSGEIK